MNKNIILIISIMLMSIITMSCSNNATNPTINNNTSEVNAVSRSIKSNGINNKFHGSWLFNGVKAADSGVKKITDQSWTMNSDGSITIQDQTSGNTYIKKEDIENTGRDTYKCKTEKGSITIKFNDNNSANVIGTENIDGKDTQVLQGTLKRK